MRMLQKALIAGLFGLGLCLCCPWGQASAVPPDPAKITVNKEPVGSDQELVRRSDLVVHGRIGEQASPHPTGQHEGTYKVVNYIQRINVKAVWKGHAIGHIQLLTSGVEPLPDADNPLNRVYTGPLEAQEYVCFLRRIPGTDYYSLIGLWRGLYPVFEGKSIALLANGGFPSFDSLSLQHFQSKVMALTGS